MEGKTAFVVYGRIQGFVRVSNMARDEGLKVQSKGLKVEYRKLSIGLVGFVPHCTRKGRGKDTILLMPRVSEGRG